MPAPARPHPRRKLGLALVVAGLGVWLVGGVAYLGNRTGLLPTIPYAGFVITSVGGLLEAVGSALARGAPVLGQVEKRRTSLVIVLPALVLFGIVLLGAALVFAENFEQPASAARWAGSTVFLLVSIAIVSALVRDVALRFDRTVVAGSGTGAGQL